MNQTCAVEHYNIPRYHGWEEILEPLVRKITGAAQGKVRTGCDYDNHIFSMHVYYEGICRCSYGDKRKDFEGQNPHAEDCFHVYWKEIDDAFKSHPLYNQSIKLKTERINMEMGLCRKFRIPYHGGSYIENKCTCGVESSWNALNVSHDEHCPKILPNFWFKESDTKIWWNKKFFRDAYSNKRITKEEFSKMIGMCLRSL